MQCQLSSRSDKKCARYPRCWKFFAAGKVDWSSLKSLKICYAPMPLTVPNITDLYQTMYEKSVTICLYLSVFWCPRGPRCAEVHQSRHWCTARADLPICQFRPLRQRVYEITAAEVRRFPWRCYRQKKQKTICFRICGDRRNIAILRRQRQLIALLFLFGDEVIGIAVWGHCDRRLCLTLMLTS